MSPAPNKAVALLVLLTGISVASGESIHLAAAAVIMALAWFKLRLVMDHFLELQSAPAWRQSLLWMTFILLGVLLAIFAAARF